MSDPQGADDSLEGLDLDLYAEVDHLTEEFRAQLGRAGSLGAEAFADAHPEQREMLLPALRAVEALARRSDPALRDLPPGTAVGRFRIVGRLGSGGMGTVYEAREEGLERSVALKVLDGAAATPDFRKRFLREARAAARLAHPAIVPVYGTGEDGALLWYAMRRIDGRPLDDLLGALDGDGPVRDAAERALARAADPDKAEGSSSVSATSASATLTAGAPRHVAVARIGQRLANALAYAHGEGVVHRDLKPGNVILDPSGRPHLTDFGMCKVEGDASLTAAADVIGTLRYLPPEGLTGEVDERGDVYGLGLVLYELLARQPAFPRAARAHIVEAIERKEPTQLRKLDPQIPRDLERIVAKATAKLRDERYDGATQFADDLAAFLAGKPIRARRLGLLYYLRLLVRRNRVAAAAIGLSIVALVLGALVYVAELRTLLDEAEGARRVAERRESLATLRFARAQLEDGDVGGTQALQAGIDESLRGWAWQHLHERVALPTMPRSIGMRRPLGVAPTPDGAGFLVHGRMEIQVLDSPSLRRRTALAVGRLSSMGSPTWSFVGAAPLANGGALAARSADVGTVVGDELAHEILHWTGERTDAPVVLGYPDAPPRHLTSNARAGVAAVAVHDRLQVIDLSGPEPRLGPLHALPGLSPVTRIAILDDGRVVLGALAGEVSILDPVTGALESVARHETTVTAIATEGDRLVATGEQGGLVFFHPRGELGQHRDSTEVEGAVTSLDLLGPDHLLCGLAGGRVARIDRRARVTLETTAYFLSSCIGALPAPGDGTGTEGPLLLSLWGRVQTWRPTAVAGVTTVASALGLVQDVALSPDGESLAFVSFDGNATLVVPDAEHRVPAESRHPAAHFGDDGRYVAFGGLVLDARTGEEVLRWEPPAGECMGAVWADGRFALLVWAAVPGLEREFRRVEYWTWVPESGEAPQRVGPLVERSPFYERPDVHVLSGSPDLLVMDSGGTLVRVRVRDGTEVWRVESGAGLSPSVAVDETRGLVLIVGAGVGLVTRDLGTGEPIEASYGDLSSAVLRGGRATDFDVHAASGRASTVFESGVVRVWSWPEGDELTHIESPLEHALTSTFAPSGDALYVATALGPVMRIGVGPQPAFVGAGHGLARAPEMLELALARLEGGGTVPERVAAMCTVGFALDGRTPPDAPPPGTLGVLLERLAARGIGAEHYRRLVRARIDDDNYVFGRFGWTPASLLEASER